MPNDFWKGYHYEGEILREYPNDQTYRACFEEFAEERGTTMASGRSLSRLEHPFGGTWRKDEWRIVLANGEKWQAWTSCGGEPILYVQYLPESVFALILLAEAEERRKQQEESERRIQEASDD